MSDRLCIPLPSWLRSGPTATLTGAGGCFDDTCDVLVVDGGTTAAQSYRTAAAIGRETASLIRAGRISGTVRTFALGACEAAGVAPGGDPCDVAAAILARAAQAVQYAPDPVRAELVQGASETIRARAGDCEDFTALVGAACESLGLAARVVLIRYAGTAGSADAYDHVFPEIDVAPRGAAAPCWAATDATLWGASGITPAVGLDPRRLASVRRQLVIDPHAAVAVAPDSMRSLASPLSGLFGFNLGGGPPGGGQFGFGGGPPGGQFGFGSGAFGFDPFGLGGTPGGGRFGFDQFSLGTGGSLFSGGGPLSKRQGEGNGDWLERILDASERLGPLLIALLGRSRQYGEARGVIYNPTSTRPPAGYTRVTDPQTGEQIDVPNDQVPEILAAADASGGQQGGGVSGTTLLLIGGAGVATYLFTRRKR